MADSEASSYPDPDDLRHIPVDLFASKNFSGLSSGDLAFADSSGNLVYFVCKSSSSHLSLFDSSGVLLFSIIRPHSGKWEVYKGGIEKQKELVISVKRISNRFSKIELDVSFAGQGCRESPHLTIKGCPFQKSCTIYSQDSIVAQTSLMYKLRQIYVGRSKFRLTIFPGSIDHPLVVTLVSVFLHGRK